jgi:hypothetical protein
MNKFMALSIFLLVPLSRAQTQTSFAALPVQSTQFKVSDFEKKNSPWGVSFFSIGGIDRSQITSGSGQQSMYFFEDYLSLTYKVSKDFRLSARYSFNYSTAGSDKFGKDVTDRIDTRDMSLLMTFSNIFENILPANMTLKFQPRLYLPTSENSKNQGEIASLRIENEARINLKKNSSLRLWINPQYYFQRVTTYLDDKNKFKGTDNYASKHGAEYNYDLNSIFSIKPGFEIEDAWVNSSVANNNPEYRKTNIDYRLGLGITVSKPLSFTVGYGHKKDLIKTDEYSDGFTLMTVATLY